MTSAAFDAIVVGAGIAGASFAHALAPHARVLLLEREEQPGVHSTGRSAAMFMESYGPPQVRALTRASRAFYERPPAGFADTPILSARGALYVGWRGQEAALDAMLRELRATGSVVERIDAAQCLRRVPVLRAEGLVGGVLEADAMDIDVHALHQGFLRGFRRAGGVLWCSAELLGAEAGGSGWTVTLTDGRRIAARTLVNAAGAWADEVARRCGAQPLGIQPKRRSAFTFALPDGVDARGWPTVADVDERWYIKPDAGQLLGSPANADPVPAHDVLPEELDIATGIAAIEAATTLTIRRPARTWAGLRSFTPDGELAIGWDAQRSGLFWLAGQGGYGIQSAAGAAELAAGLWRGAPLSAALKAQGVATQALDPARFAR
ncbi:MAG: FAD-dependent catabolic D-arginine dehydrogenase DauA [Burkholderiaceae bacterium]|nr:FAD-dependent catabolic D-arginine dehydrogenase DauA [Burkholderiaceae bacterium]